MAGENTESRVDVVTGNITAVETQRGPEEYLQIITQCAKDISISLAMLVDAGNSSGE